MTKSLWGKKLQMEASAMASVQTVTEIITRMKSGLCSFHNVHRFGIQPLSKFTGDNHERRGRKIIRIEHG